MFCRHCAIVHDSGTPDRLCPLVHAQRVAALRAADTGQLWTAHDLHRTNVHHASSRARASAASLRFAEASPRLASWYPHCDEFIEQCIGSESIASLEG